MEDYRRTLLIDPSEIKDTTLISFNLEESYLKYTTLTDQNIYLAEITGDALYRRLQEILFNTINEMPDGLDDNPAYADLLEECVKPFLSARITVDILWNMAFKIRNMGVVQNSDTNMMPMSLTDVRELQKQYQTYVDAAADTMSKYLCANADIFPELTATVPSWYRPARTDEDFGNTGGLWLGRSLEKKCHCGK